MSTRRDFLKIAGATFTLVPIKGCSTSSPKTEPGILFIDTEAVDIDTFASLDPKDLPEILQGTLIVAVHVPRGKTVIDCIAYVGPEEKKKALNALEATGVKFDSIRS